ncbi:hypothetical protein DOY81_003331 [Sarcophaga bullata]|nr:hypothetical protein DOY81_003331 [Sarcophaga bullata]
MELVKKFSVDIFIGILNVLAYIYALIANVGNNFFMGSWNDDDWQNKEVHPGEKFYSYCYNILYSIFIFIMIIASISLIRGVIKRKQNPLIGSRNYQNNLTQNDPSILQPLNLDEEFEKYYINPSEINLNKFEI